MTAYTPGPWRFDDVWALIKGPHREEIAAVHSGQMDTERKDRGVAYANAGLIAAAPELYESLRDVLRIAKAASVGVPSNGPRIDRAIAALTKAEGWTP